MSQTPTARTKAGHRILQSVFDGQIRDETIVIRRGRHAVSIRKKKTGALSTAKKWLSHVIVCCTRDLATGSTCPHSIRQVGEP